VSPAPGSPGLVGHGTGNLLAIVALDGSLIGANLTALTTAYTLGDVYPRMRHSLHWKPNQAAWFYGLYAILIGLSAVVTLAWGNDLDVVINGVEALNGILLPSALVLAAARSPSAACNARSAGPTQDRPRGTALPSAQPAGRRPLPSVPPCPNPTRGSQT
jgi:hypothetical protein